MPINELKEILEILKALDKTTKEQLDKAMENADKEESQVIKMYQEWMDAIPLLVEGCHKHNIQQLRKAEEYWKREENIERAESIRNEINIELSKL